MEDNKNLKNNLIRQYAKVAKKIEKGDLNLYYINFEDAKNRKNLLKEKIELFLKSPSKKNLRELWDKTLSCSAQEKDQATHILKKLDIEEIKEIIESIKSASNYDPVWEENMGVKSPLREFWGILKDKPIENRSTKYGLSFMGYPKTEEYADFIQNFSDFKNEYLSILGKKATSYDINIEIDNLFNFINKADLTDFRKKKADSSDGDIRKLYEIKIEIEDKNITNLKYFQNKIKDYLDFREKKHDIDLEEYGIKKWSEGYKWNILPKVHKEFFKEDITDQNITEKIDILISHNPQSGSFVHWGSLQDLKEACKKNPKKVADLFNYLFNSDDILSLRIDEFVGEIKKINKDAKIGTPLIGYIMAVYDYKNYPVYKDSVFTYIKKNIEKDWSSYSIGEKYYRFTSLCKAMGANLNEKGYLKETEDSKGHKIIPGIEAIDGQDFFYISKFFGKSNYWWLNANPKIWSFNQINEGETFLYTLYNEKGNPRKVERYFKEVRVGDKVIGYTSDPEKKITSICEITKEAHESKEGEAIELKVIEHVSNPITLEKLRKSKKLSNCEPLINHQGSLFKLKEEEFQIINNIIKNKEDMKKIPKNLILYGPPGTGKTYKAKKIAEEFLKNQSQQKTEGEYLAEILSDLKWHEVIGIAMLKRSKGLSVPEIKDEEIVKIYSTFCSKSKTPQNTIARTLQSCSTPESSQTSYRNDSNLFYKGDNYKWFLTEEGEEFFNGEEYQQIIEQIKDPKPEQKNWKDFCSFITFHQSYSYEEFVEGIRPILDSEQGSLNYELRDGVFKEICKRGEADLENNYVLIIDEINRGNISKIFGEIITLVEENKRSGESEETKVVLPYSGEIFKVPSNLYIIGTMNTADRSIALLDVALRRRFNFEELMPDSDVIENKISGLDLAKLMESLNRRIRIMIDRDHQVGHSYFMNIKDKEELKVVWYEKIIPLLQEYFYNDREKLENVLGRYEKDPERGFVYHISNADIRREFGDNDADDLIDSSPAEIKEYSKEELVEVLKRMYG